MLQSKIDFLKKEKLKQIEYQQTLESERSEIKNNFQKILNIASKQEGSRSTADFLPRAEGRK